MIYLQRKLKAKFTGADDYLPEGVPRNKFMPVIGFEIRKREATKNDKTVIVEDIFYIITTDKGKLISIASFNCSTMIDEQAEWDVQKALSLMNNVSLIGKVLSEKVAKNSTEKHSKEDDK